MPRRSLPLYNIFKQASRSILYAKRYIIKDSVTTAFSLILHNRVMEHIKTFTEAETRQILYNDGFISRVEHIYSNFIFLCNV
jgi:hypothetical protein